MHSTTAKRQQLSGRVTPRKLGVMRRRIVVLRRDLDEALEDAELNAIADERAEGPFVSVSLDDL